MRPHAVHVYSSDMVLKPNVKASTQSKPQCEAWPRCWARRKQAAAHVCFCKSFEAGSFQDLTENKFDIESVSSARGPKIAPGQRQDSPNTAQVKMPNKVYIFWRCNYAPSAQNNHSLHRNSPAHAKCKNRLLSALCLDLSLALRWF